MVKFQSAEIHKYEATKFSIEGLEAITYNNYITTIAITTVTIIIFSAQGGVGKE